MEYNIEYIGGDEAIVKFEGSIHIDCRDKKDWDFRNKLDNLIDEYAI